MSGAAASLSPGRAASVAVIDLNRRYFLDFPAEAAAQIERVGSGSGVDEVVAALAQQPAQVLLPVLRRLNPSVASTVVGKLPDSLLAAVFEELEPAESVRLLAQMAAEQVEPLLALIRPEIARGLRELMSYPGDSAGRLMDPRFVALRGSMTAHSALELLRKSPSRTARSLFLIDDNNHLSAKVAIQDVAVADSQATLDSLSVPVSAFVNQVASLNEVSDTFDLYKLADLPVTDLDGHLLGIIYHADLVQVMQETTTADLQSMVGASKDERALSRPMFAVRKRLPWLQVNLLTAFLAAAVVGLFEDTIARFTALAVLLPVVAGQSGNAGAQALAVTMRGLALREITVRHWLRVMFKEVQAGFVNGLAVALSCGVAVFFWSGSIGLVTVIALSMVLAMTAAGFAGALVPIVLTRLGQDPAQSSSIILTTVTDVAGFFSFLGIATLLSSMI